ncbi:MAG: hypothetical protein AAB368_02695, partial [bacterium]
MRIFVSTGEESGDLYGALLTRELKRRARGVTIEGFGGARMKEAGARVDSTLLGAAVIGWTGVLRHARTYLRLLAGLRRRWRRDPPDAVVLIDNPGFNLRVARIAAARAIPVASFICPQVWGWGAQRLILMRRVLRRAYPVLPFEEDLLRAFGIRAAFLGHPILDVLPARPPSRGAACARAGLDPRRPLHLLLPGSRTEEVARHLPLMLEAARRFRDAGRAQWVVVVTRDSAAAVESFASSSPVAVTLTRDPGYALRANADLVWTKSGTATLELGLLGVPQVVVYRMHWINWLIVTSRVQVGYAGLVNLILGRRAVPELLQGAFTPDALVRASRALRVRGRARVPRDPADVAYCIDCDAPEDSTT